MNAFLLTAALLVGCTSPDQIWLLQIPYVSEPDCTQDITHNFRDAYVPTTPPGDWTETDVSEQSDTLVFAHLSKVDADTAVLVIAGEVWPGTSTGGGEWEFTWTGVEDNRLTREHDEGYRYTEQAYLEYVDVISLTLDGSVGEGSWASTSIVDSTYTETDEWDFAVGMTVGDIPSASYLAYDEGEVEGIPQANIGDEADCNDAICQLRVKDTCAESRDFEATLTGFDTEEAYDQLEGATQPYGT